MIRKLPILAIIVFTIISSSLYAQNCTLNAGIATTICPGEPFELTATSNSALAMLSPPKWTQIGGPAVTITAEPLVVNGQITTAKAKITNYVAGGVYRFRVTGQCQDGSTIFQDVDYTVSNLSVASAGNDQVTCPGIFQLQGSSLKPGEIGRWVKISGDNGMPDPTNSSSPNATLDLPANASPMSAIYSWTVIGGNCSSTAQVKITNLGTQPVSAGPNQNLSCYNVTTSTLLNGSYAGAHAASGQLGTWSFISGPSNPVFDDVNKHNTRVSNLVEGVYTLRWTVSGPCQSGSADVKITVGPANQAITNAGGNTDIYCDGRTSVLLRGPAASYAGETVEWTLISGPGSPTIVYPNSNVTTVVGLNATAGSTYVFNYKITNPNTGCVSNGEYRVVFNIPPNITIQSANPYFGACGQNFAAVKYTVSGGTTTQFALVSAPAGSALEASLGGLNNFVTAEDSEKEIEGFTKSGTYILRYRRSTNNNVGGCSDYYIDVKIVISSNTISSNAGTEQKLACNVVNATLSANSPLIGVGRWSQVAGPNVANIVDEFNPLTSINGLINGRYTFRWIISGGDGSCINSQSDVDVLVSTPETIVSTSGTSRTTCYGSPVTLQGNTPQGNEVGTWTVLKNGNPAPEVVFSNVNDPKATVTGLLANTPYTFTWTITSPCSTGSSSVVITTTSTASATQANAGPDQCLPASATKITLSGNAAAVGETGTWSLVSGPAGSSFVDPNSPTTDVNITQIGNYVFRWSINNGGGCDPTIDDVLITVSPAATIATVGPDQNDCLSPSITLSGNNPTIGTGTWTQIEGPGGAIITDIHQYNSTVTGLMSGRYKFRWTITNGGCSGSSFADLTVNLSDSPDAAYAGIDQAICTSSTTLNATPVTKGKGRWAVISGPNVPHFSNIADPHSTLSGLVYGNYELQWITSGGLFCSENTDNVIISVKEAANAGTNQVLCNVNSVALNGNNNSTGTWTAKDWPGYPSVTNQPTLTPNGSSGAIATNLISGTYVFTYTLNDGGACLPNSADVTYKISSPPTVANAGPDQSECSNTLKVFQLAANTPAVGTGKWSIEDGPAGTFSDVNDPNATFTPSTEGVFLLKWQIINGDCVGATASTDYVKIFMSYPPSTSNAGTDQVISCSNSATLTATTPTIGFGKWELVSGPNAANVIIEYPNSASTLVRGLEVGSYVFRWTVTNGICSPSTSTVNITINSIPPVAANAGLDQTLCYSGATVSANLTGNTPGVGETGKWTIVSNSSGAVLTFGDDTQGNTTIGGLTSGTYTLKWTTTKGTCSSDDNMVITVVNQEPAVILTPNSSQFCLYAPVALDAQAISSGTGTWKIMSKPAGAVDPVFSAANASHTEVYGLIAGTYQFTYTTSSGICSDNVSAPVSIIILELPTPSAAGVSKSTCYNVPVALSAQPVTVGTGKWTVVSPPPGAIFAFSDDTSPTSTFSATNNVTPTTDMVFTLKWTTSNGTCESSSLTQVTVKPPLAGNQIGISTAKTCSGTTVNLSDVAPPTGGYGTYNYTWQQSTDGVNFTNISGSGTTLTTASLTNTTNADITYYFRRVASSGNCEVLNSNVVSVLVQPRIGNTINTTAISICFKGNSGVLSGNPPTGGDGVNYTYQWQYSKNSTSAYSNVPVNGAFDGTQSNYEPAEFENTTNSVDVYRYRRVVTSDGCSINSSVKMVTVNPKPILTSATTANVCSNTPFNYTPTSNVAGATFTWTRAAVAGIDDGATTVTRTGAINETLVNTTNTAKTVKYIFTVAANGCTNPDTFELTLTVNPSPRGTNDVVTSLTCGNGTFTYNLQNNVNAVVGIPSSFTWTVASNANVTGQADGTGNTINQTLVNTSNVVQQVVYTITPKSTLAGTCDGQPFTLTVTVPVCEGVTITKTTTKTTVSTVGEQIPYKIVVKNTGNAAQNNVVVNDPFLGGVLSNPVKTGGNQDNILDRGETWTYTGNYTVTQSDIDNFGKPSVNSGKISNIATLTTTEHPVPQTAGTDVNIDAISDFTVVKASSTTQITTAGQVVPYTVTVKNTGNTAISNLVVNDPMLSNITLISGDTNGNSKLDVTETWIFGGSYIVKQADLDNNGNIDASGKLKNVVTVSGKKPDGTSTPALTSNVDIPIVATGSFDVKKASTTTVITKAGQVVPYTITVANTGKVAVSNIVVTDPLLGALTLYSGDITPANNKLDVNETWTYTGSYTVTQNDIDNNGNNGTYLGKLFNRAAVTGNYPDGTSDNKTTNDVLIPITPYIAYKIEKKSTETAITYAGQVIPYTITVTNIGDGVIKDLVISDPMLSGSPLGNLASLAKGASQVYTANYTVKQTDIDNNGNTSTLGVLSNTATVTGNKPDGTALTPATATELIPLKTTTAFTVVKTADKAVITSAADLVTYTIKVKNTGTTAITNVQFSDPMLSNITGPIEDKVSNNILDLDETWTYTGTYQVTQANIDKQGNLYPNGQLTNTANVTGNKPDGSNAGSVSSKLDIPINPAASFVLTKTSNVASVNKVGDLITYTVTVSNNGQVAIDNLLITDPMVNLAYQSGDVNTDGKLDVTETWTYSGTYKVSQDDIDNNGNQGPLVGKLKNTVSVSGRKPDGTLIPTVTASNEVNIAPTSSLSIVKATTATAISKAGQVVPYTIRVNNTGTVAVSNVVVNDPLLSSSALVLSYGDVNGNGKLDINETWIYQANYTVTQSDLDNNGNGITLGQLVNKATVTGQTPQGSISAVTSNTVNVPVKPVVSYTIEKTSAVSSVTNAGQVIHYTITVKNTGDAAISNVVVNDPLLSGVALTPNATDANGKLDVGETWVYEADYTVKQSDIDNNGNTLVKGILSNTASVSGLAPDGTVLPVLSDTKVIPLNTSTSFTVNKVANKANVNKAGDVITYTITVANTGVTAITNVVVNDPLTGGIIAAPKSGDVANPGVLDIGETWIFEGSYTVTQSDIDKNGNSLSGGQVTANGNILNLVTVTGDKPNGSSAGTVTAENSVPIVPTPSFSLTKVSNVNAVNKAGDLVIYTVTATNTGSVALNSLEIKDPMVNLKYDSGDLNQDGKLNVGEAWIYKGTYTVTQDDIDQNGNGVITGKLVNVVSANGRKPDGSPVYGSDITANNSLNISPTGAMTVKKGTSTVAITEAGQEVTYAITVANTGTVAISNVTVSDPLLSNITLYSGDVNGNGIMDVRETWTFTGTYTVKQSDIDQFGYPIANSGKLVNTASAAGLLPNNSPINGVSNTVEIPITLTNAAYSIEKNSTTTQITVAGQSVPYTITVKNIGSSAIKNVTVTDPMLGGNVTTYFGDTNSNGILDVNEIWTYTGSYTVQQSDIDNNGNTSLKGVLSNTATLSGNRVNGTALAAITATKVIPLNTSTLFTVTKIADKPNVSKAGDVINYQIKVANTGVTAITNVVVNDPLLGGVIAQPTSGDVANLGVLDVNEEWVYTGSYTVTQADIDRNGNVMANNHVYANGSIINIVNVSGEKPDGSSAGRITATNIVPIQPIATLSLTKTSDVTTVSKAGDVITYTVKVRNTGVVALNTITVADPMVNLIYVNGDLNNNGKLEIDEEWTYTGKYTVTQEDIDQNGNGVIVGKLVNQVSVQGRQPNGTLTPVVSTTANVDITMASAMTISKNTTTTQITTAGQLVPYTITIANTGKSAISNVIVNDPLLTNLAYTNGDINGNNKLDVNETWTYAGSYIITQQDIDQIKNAPISGQFRNVASVTGTNPDGSSTGTLTSTKDIPVLQTMSVDFKKVVTGQVGYIAGQIVSYEIKVINTGNTTLKNIVVTDNNATVISGSPIAQLNPGQTTLVLAEHVLTQADVDAGKVINQAELIGVDPNGDPITKKSDDPSTATPDDPTLVQIVSPGSISLVKTAVLSGDGNTITYSFTVKNPGIVTLSNVTISDPKFPSPIAVTPSVMPPNSTGTATAVYTITQIEKMAGQVSNTAIVTGVMPNGFKVNDISGTNENNNEPTVVILPKITGNKTVADANGNGKIEAGEQLTYTITVSNDGDVDRTDVVVKDPLPAHTNYVNGSASNNGSFSGGIVNWTNLTVPAKSSINISFKVTVDASLPLDLMQIENIASVIDPAKPTDPISVKTSLPTEGKLESSKIVNDNKGNKDNIAQANEIISYGILVTNRGGSLLSGVKIKDVLPAGLSYVAGSASNAGVYTAGSNQLDWTIDIASGASVTLTFDVKVVADVNGINKISNTADILSPTGQSLQPSVDMNVDPSADLVITKELLTPAPVKTGDYVSYKITVQNLGQNKATGVTVTDQLPGSLDVPIEIQIDQGTTNYNKADKKLNWLVGDLALNELRTLTFKTRIVAKGTLVNSATVSGDQPDDKLNNNKVSSGGHYIDGQELLIPNLFTPNGDGNNDTFEILGLNQYLNNELVIVNRWGNEVFRAKNYQNNWTGEGLNEGTYYYLLKVQKTNSSEWMVFKGYVTLIRAFKK